MDGATHRDRLAGNNSAAAGRCLDGPSQRPPMERIGGCGRVVRRTARCSPGEVRRCLSSLCGRRCRAWCGWTSTAHSPTWSRTDDGWWRAVVDCDPMPATGSCSTTIRRSCRTLVLRDNPMGCTAVRNCGTPAPFAGPMIGGGTFHRGIGDLRIARRDFHPGRHL